PLLQKPWSPINAFRTDWPIERCKRISRGTCSPFGFSICRSANGCAMVYITSEEIERLADNFHVARGNPGHCCTKGFHGVLGISPEDDGVGPPGITPDLSVIARRYKERAIRMLEHCLTGRRDIRGTFRSRITNHTDARPSDGRC